MKKQIAVAILVLMTIGGAEAASLKGGFSVCMTEELLDQMTQATVSKDERGFEYLLKNGCGMSKAGVPVSVLSSTWTGVVKVRAYAGDDTLELWTYRENIIE